MVLLAAGAEKILIKPELRRGLILNHVKVRLSVLFPLKVIQNICRILVFFVENERYLLIA